MDEDRGIGRMVQARENDFTHPEKMFKVSLTGHSRKAQCCPQGASQAFIVDYTFPRNA